MNGPPRVVIDARDGFSPRPRGWGRYARCLVGALSAPANEDPKPLELTVISTGGRGPEVFFEQVSLPLLLRRRAAALVHATDCFLPLTRHCPGVVTIHDLAFEDLRHDVAPRTRIKYRVFARAAARSAERVICPSSFTRSQLCSRYGIDPGKVRVIPLAPALPSREAATRSGADQGAPCDQRACSDQGVPYDQPESCDQGAPYVLAVGDLREKKNLAPLVRAFAGLWREGECGHRLVLAGLDAGEGARLRALAGDAPIELTGYLGDERLDALIREAVLLVAPGLHEGFGLVVLEAMARGTPVLAASAGALPETGADAAAYFDPAAPGALREALGELLADSEARGRLADAGRARAAGFSWRRTAQETAAVYRELVY